MRFLGDRTAFDETLTRTDEFNRLAKIAPASEFALLPSDREPDKQLDRIETLYAKADALSVRFSKQYRRILAALAIISTVITIAFLLYDEAELHGMILVCGGMLLLAWLVQRYGNRFASHRRYLEYRMLAEGLRVQAFLRYAGSGLTASDVLPRSAQTETGWVAAALKVCAVGNVPYPRHSIRAPWVEQQHAYHRRSVGRSERAHKGSERIVRAALWISILLYLAVLAFELVWGGLLPVSRSIPNAGFYRTLSKLLLGSISAATLFISNYYGRLSLSRTTADHARMERFYAGIVMNVFYFLTQIYGIYAWQRQRTGDSVVIVPRSLQLNRFVLLCAIVAVVSVGVGWGAADVSPSRANIADCGTSVVSAGSSPSSSAR